MNTRTSSILSLSILLAISGFLAGCGGGGGGTPLNLQDKIVYQAGVAGRYQLFSMNSDGTGTTQLTTEGINQDASITCDGQTVVFSSDRTGVSQVFSMRYDGSNETQLTSDARPANQPAISGDGSKIVFYRSVDYYTPSNIYIMNSTGGTATIIPNSSNSVSPALNYDASKITFIAHNGNFFTVYVMDIDGSHKTEIMSSPRVTGEAPKFSPDGSKIVYYADAGMHRQVAIYDINSATTTVVTDDANNNQNPCFNSDGTKIILCRIVLGDENIFSMNLDGTGEVKLTTGGVEMYPACPMNPPN